MKKTAVLIVLLICFFSKAQPPAKFYTKFGGSGIDIGYSGLETFNRQYAIVGSTTSFGDGSTNVYLLLVDSMGQPLWEKTFGGAMADVGKSIILNPTDSGFVIAGFTSSYGNGGYDLYVIRTDKNGNLKWQSSFGGMDWDFGNDLTLGSDGNVIVCGTTHSYGYGKTDGYIMKVNITNGTQVWVKYYGGIEDDDFRSVKLTSDGYYTIAGNTQSYGDINNDFWFFKINNSGDSITSKNFGNPNKKEMCYDFMEDNFNNLVFCGSYDTSFYNTGKNEGYLIKTNLNGAFLNQIRYAGAGSNDRFLSVTRERNGNNYFFSRSVNKPSFEMEAQPFHTDFNLNHIFSTTYVGNKDEEAYKVFNTKDNGFVMVGYTKSFNLVSEDVFFVKVDSTLLNSVNIVGLKELKQNKSPEKIYYFDNKLYFDNSYSKLLTYSIMNSQGKVLIESRTNGNVIQLNPDMATGVYVARIGDKPPIKFIKN